MNEKLGIEMRTTAGEWTFSNGIIERQDIFEAIIKTLEDVRCDPGLQSWS